MNKAYKIFKVGMYNVFSLNKFKQKSLIRKIGTILLIFYIFISVMFSLGFYSYGIADSLSKVNMMPLYLIIFLNFSSIIVLFTTMRTSKNTLYDSKDKELLLSLPVKTSEIIFAKLLDMYLISFIISTLALIPSFVIYIIKVNPAFMFYILFILSIFIIPIIPTLIASLVGYILARILPKSNKKNIIEIIFSFIFIFAIMIVNSSINGVVTGLATHGKTIETILKYISYPTYLLRESLFDLKVLSFILYIIINIILLILFINILKNNYKKIISKSNENTLNKNRNQKKLVSSSITKALLKREGNGFVASPIYILNTTFGIVILFVLSIASLFYDKSKIFEQLMISDTLDISYLLLLFLTFVIGMTNITASSISMEKNRFWILKSLPIKEKTIINTKVLFSVLVVVPITIISLIIFKFSLNINTLNILLLIIFSIVYSYAIAKFGVIINLKYPKLDALNDQVIVKQGASSMVTVLGPMTLYILIIAFFAETLIKMNFLLLCLVLIVLFLVFTLIFNHIINTWGVNKLKKIV